MEEGKGKLHAGRATIPLAQVQGVSDLKGKEREKGNLQNGKQAPGEDPSSLPALGESQEHHEQKNEGKVWN